MANNTELLQTPFSVVLYGRPIKGVNITREHLNGRIRERRMSGRSGRS
jgi:hypothetical protein